MKTFEAKCVTPALMMLLGCLPLGMTLSAVAATQTLPTKSQAAAAAAVYKRALEQCDVQRAACEAGARRQFVKVVACVIRGQRGADPATVDEDFIAYADMVSGVLAAEGDEHGEIGPCFTGLKPVETAKRAPAPPEGPTLEALKKFREQAEQLERQSIATSPAPTDQEPSLLDRLKADVEAVRGRVQPQRAVGAPPASAASPSSVVPQQANPAASAYIGIPPAPPMTSPSGRTSPGPTTAAAAALPYTLVPGGSPYIGTSPASPAAAAPSPSTTGPPIHAVRLDRATAHEYEAVRVTLLDRSLDFTQANQAYFNVYLHGSVAVSGVATILYYKLAVSVIGPQELVIQIPQVWRGSTALTGLQVRPGSYEVVLIYTPAAWEVHSEHQLAVAL